MADAHTCTRILHAVRQFLQTRAHATLYPTRSARMGMARGLFPLLRVEKASYLCDFPYSNDLPTTVVMVNKENTRRYGLSKK